MLVVLVLLEFARRRHCANHARNTFDNPSEVDFTSAECFFGSFAVIDIRYEVVPTDDPPVPIEHRKAPRSKLSIASVSVQGAVFDIDRLPRFNRVHPCLYNPFFIVRVQ